MTTKGNPIDRASVYAGVGAISGSGVLVSSTAPVVVGALSNRFAFDQSQLGDILAFYNLAFTVVAVAALFVIRKINWKFGALIASAIGVAGFALLTQVSDFFAVAMLFVLIGLGAGALYAIGMAVMGDSSTPDRAFGWKLGLESAPSVVLLNVVPILMISIGGFSTAAFAFAATFLLLGIGSFALPSSGVKGDGLLPDLADAPETAATSRSKTGSFLALAGSIMFFTGIAASYAFLELIAAEKAMPPEGVGLAFSVGLGIAAGGGFLAGWLGDRLGRLLPIIAGVAINILGLALIGLVDDMILFTIGLWLFIGTVNFGLAYFFGLSALVDLTGRFVVLSATTLSVGGVIGPMIAGRLIEHYGYGSVLVFSAVCGLVSLAFFALVMKRHVPLRAPLATEGSAL